MNDAATKDPKRYRPCAGMMVVNQNGRVFVGKRIDTKEGDWWQMPQGGIDPGEDSDAAALRELEEETGIPPHKVEIAARHDVELFYDLPEELQGRLWGGQYIGQRQLWYLVRFNGDEDDIDLAAHDHPEFERFQWVDPEVLPDMIIPFKRAIYQAVVDAFRDRI